MHTLLLLLRAPTFVMQPKQYVLESVTKKYRLSLKKDYRYNYNLKEKRKKYKKIYIVIKCVLIKDL